MSPTWATAALLVAVLSKEALGLPPIPIRRQVLPPVPGYIPVYIQHGDAAPEDSVELAELFRVAGENRPITDAVSDIVFGAAQKAPAADEASNSVAPDDEKGSQDEPADQPGQHGHDRLADHAAVDLAGLPEKVDIAPDKLSEMIDASKADAEESQTNNEENSSQSSGEEAATEEATPTTNAP